MKTDRKKLLIVDDDEKILYAFREVFKKDGYQSIVAHDGQEALERAAEHQPAVVIMDITMPKLDGLQALKRLKEQSPATPVILITGFGTMQTAIRAIQLGAFEYLTKPLDVTVVRDVVRRAQAAGSPAPTLAEEPVSFQSETVSRYELVGRSPRMQEVFKMIGSVSTTPNHTSVMILGESGTGKELVARAIHANSEFAQEPFVAINCVALPDTLLESELFGFEKGAFTGAGEMKPGKFEVARRGTIFLDEIGNLTPHLQQKLLRVLQEREFDRLGGTSSHRVEARFITATNQDLQAGVRNKSFREDLFFRLNVVTINLPPLRERPDDVPLLAAHLLRKYNDQLKKNIQGFARESLALLCNYSYPGNVRELENLIERAVMLTKGSVILPDVFGELQSHPAPRDTALPIVSPVFSTSRNYLLGLFEKQFLAHQLALSHGNVTAAAASSRMTRQNFQRLMKKYGLDSSSFKK